MKLDEKHKQLLKHVAEGKLSFGPGENSVESFQITAERLIPLDDYGFIRIKEPHKESRSGHRYIDLVVVESLTEKGAEAVSQFID